MVEYPLVEGVADPLGEPRPRYVGDLGRHEVEEIDVLPANTRGLVNSGWSVVGGTRRCKRNVAPNTAGRLVRPKAQYPHASMTHCGGDGVVAGGYICRGDRIPVPRITSFGDDADGELYAVSAAGRLHALVPGESGT